MPFWRAKLQISLMQDQVMGLTEKGISAVFLGSAQKDREATWKAVDGEYSVVFVSVVHRLPASRV
jgi:superfamily II DNA helicase RecQ